MSESETTKFWRIKVGGRYAYWSPSGWSLWDDEQNSTGWPTEAHALDAREHAPEKIKYDGVIEYV